jgi:hypothetical protein
VSGFKLSYAMVGSFLNDHFIVLHPGDASDLFFQLAKSWNPAQSESSRESSVRQSVIVFVRCAIIQNLRSTQQFVERYDAFVASLFQHFQLKIPIYHIHNIKQTPKRPNHTTRPHQETIKSLLEE